MSASHGPREGQAPAQQESLDLKDYIRTIPDFPEPGVLFRDITPLLQRPAAFRYAVDRMSEEYVEKGVDVVVGIDARGFLLAAPLAYLLGKPLVVVRKEGKLPSTTLRVSYELEYGANSVEVHSDSISPGQRVVIVDDLLATGGTLKAAAELVERSGGVIVGLAVLIELTDLGGRRLLEGYPVFSLVRY